MPDTTATPKLGDRFERALADAARWHRPDRRKGTDVPYVSHLLSVCALVLEDGGTEDDAIAALLHDAVEDAPDAAERARRRAAIRERYGAEVLEIVEACSDTDQTPKPPWRQRKEAHLAHLRAHATPAVRRVVAADKLHNARALVADYRRLGEPLWERFNAGRNDTLWYYRSMVELLRAGSPGPLVDELTRTVEELHRAVAAAVTDGTAHTTEPERWPARS